MTHQTYRRAAVAAVVVAVVFAASALHFAWREFAYWNTGEQITVEEMHRAQALSDILGWFAAVACAMTIVLICLFARARRRA